MSGTQVRIGESCPDHGGFYYDWVRVDVEPPLVVRGPACCVEGECWPIDVGFVDHPFSPIGRAHLAALAARSSQGE